MKSSSTFDELRNIAKRNDAVEWLRERVRALRDDISVLAQLYYRQRQRAAESTDTRIRELSAVSSDALVKAIELGEVYFEALACTRNCVIAETIDSDEYAAPKWQLDEVKLQRVADASDMYLEAVTIARGIVQYVDPPSSSPSSSNDNGTSKST